MPVKVKNEEEDVKQIAGAIGKALPNEVFIEKGKGEYKDRYWIYLTGEKSPFGFIRNEGNYYLTQLSYKDVLRYLNQKEALKGKNDARQFLTLYSLKSAIVAILESNLKGFRITHSEVGAYYLVFHIQKTESSG